MFNSEKFQSVWQLWKKHKQELSQRPYTATAEESALSSLFWQSHGIEDLAIQSINESIENNWAKVCISKNYNRNGNGQINGSTTSSNTKGTSTDRVEALRNW